jgi:hypothetical protein
LLDLINAVATGARCFHRGLDFIDLGGVDDVIRTGAADAERDDSPQ